MANSHFNPKAGDFGEQHIAVTRTLPTAVITASNTVRHYMPLPAAELSAEPFTDLYFYKGGALTFGGTTSSTAGTVTARVVKRNAAGTIIPLSATRTIPTGTALGTILSFPILSTATDQARTIRPSAGDTIAIEVTATAGVTTQPGDVQAAVKLAVLR